MEIGHYTFAFFIFLLICIIMLLGKRLFADLKRQKKFLDEKESKLLLLYRTVEESLEEFFDQVSEAKNEIKMLGSLQTKSEPQASELPLIPVASAQSSPPPKKAKVEKTAALPESPRFKRVLDELIDDNYEEKTEKPAAAPSRNEIIMLLWGEGKDKTQIAQILGITKTEVEIVLGLNGNTPKVAR